MGTSGCVSYMFNRLGVIVVERTPDMDEDEMMMLALDAGASDFEATEEAFEISTAVSDFSAVREALEKEGITFASAEIEWVPDTLIAADEDVAQKLDILIEPFEELDDVQNVYHNADI